MFGLRPTGKHGGRIGSSSLFLLSETNMVRRLTLFIIEWPPFEWTVLVTIIASCVVMALEEHLPNGDKTELAISLEATESYFLAIFCVSFITGHPLYNAHHGFPDTVLVGYPF